jgi:hypothetical protein
MKALILNNKVVDVASVEFEVNSNLTWIDCTDDCVANQWEVKDGVLQAIPEPVDTRTYAEKRMLAYNRLNQFELIGDDATNGTTTHRDAIATIKAAHPKP